MLIKSIFLVYIRTKISTNNLKKNNIDVIVKKIIIINIYKKGITTHVNKRNLIYIVFPILGNKNFTIKI